MPLDAGAVKVAVLAETNAYRALKNIPQLQKNAALEAAYAIYLAEHEKMGHTADGSNPSKRVSAQGYKVCFISPARIFISYFRKDGARAVATLRKDLVAEHCSVWQDISALEGNRDWWLGITAAGMRWRRGTLRSEHIEVIVAAR